MVNTHQVGLLSVANLLRGLLPICLCKLC